MNYYYHHDVAKAKEKIQPCCENCKYKLKDFCGNAESNNYENSVYPDGCCTDWSKKNDKDSKT